MHKLQIYLHTASTENSSEAIQFTAIDGYLLRARKYNQKTIIGGHLDSFNH